MLVLAAKFVAKAEHVSEIIQMCNTVTVPSRKEAGCISYNFYQHPGSSEFIFFEEWESQAILDAHFKTPHFNAFIAPLAGMLDGRPSMRVYVVSGSKEL
jgi:quinol monooxygenase YgiN